jgi:hypothetical protein
MECIATTIGLRSGISIQQTECPPRLHATLPTYRDLLLTGSANDVYRAAIGNSPVNHPLTIPDPVDQLQASPSTVQLRGK